MKVFQPHGRPRIVLATNVAETSLTVPRIRYVVDAGDARVKRYSYRNKVEMLRVEPISQADKEKLGNALVVIRREDPSFRSHFDEETGQTIMDLDSLVAERQTPHTFLVANYNGALTSRLFVEALDGAEEALARAGGRRVHHPLDRVLDVGRGELAPIVEAHAASQMHDVRQRVRRLPAGRERPAPETALASQRASLGVDGSPVLLRLGGVECRG